MLTRYMDQRPQVLGLIDIGSSKICSLIAERSFAPDGRGEVESVRILGAGTQRARGIKAGSVVDFDQAETAVRHAVSRAERMAGVTLDDVVVNVSCGRMKSLHFRANANLDAGYVRPEDLSRLQDGAWSYAERDGREVIHLNRIGYHLDDMAEVRKPLRMAGRRLSAEYHAVTVDATPLENIRLLLERCYLGAREFVPSGFASAFAVTTEDERRFGVIVLDIGEGTTDIALIADGQFLYSDAIPVGSAHVTYDLARALGMPLAEAERIKALYGTMVGAASDERQIISFERAGAEEGEQGQTTKAELRRVLYPRMHGQLMLIEERIRSCDLLRTHGLSVVLTGGGGQLIGLPTVAADVLGRPVRVGHTRLLPGMPDSFASPSFATLTGMLAVSSPEKLGRGHRQVGAAADNARASYLGRVTNWLRESF